MNVCVRSRRLVIFLFLHLLDQSLPLFGLSQSHQHHALIVTLGAQRTLHAQKHDRKIILLRIHFEYFIILHTHSAKPVMNFLLLNQTMTSHSKKLILETQAKQVNAVIFSF